LFPPFSPQKIIVFLGHVVCGSIAEKLAFWRVALCGVFPCPTACGQGTWNPGPICPSRLSCRRHHRGAAKAPPTTEKKHHGGAEGEGGGCGSRSEGGAAVAAWKTWKCHDGFVQVAGRRCIYRGERKRNSGLDDGGKGDPTSEG